MYIKMLQLTWISTDQVFKISGCVASFLFKDLHNYHTLRPSAHHHPASKIQEARRVVEPTFPNHHDICWPVKATPLGSAIAALGGKMWEGWKHCNDLKCHALNELRLIFWRGARTGLVVAGTILGLQIFRSVIDLFQLEKEICRSHIKLYIKTCYGLI